MPTETIVLAGRTRGRRAWMPREGAVPLLAFLMFVFLIIEFVTRGFADWRGYPAFLVLWGTLGAAAFARQVMILGGCRSRAWLGAGGCRQSDADDFRRVFDLGGRLLFFLLFGGFSLVFASWHLPPDLRLPVFGAGTFLTLVILALLYVSWRVKRPQGDTRRFPQLPADPVPKVTSWERIVAVKLDATTGGRHRLRLRADLDVAGPYVREAVDLEFDATPEHAAALRGRIERWHRAAVAGPDRR